MLPLHTPSGADRGRSRADPAATLEVPEEYLRRVADIHSRGGYGSIG